VTRFLHVRFDIRDIITCTKEPLTLLEMWQRSLDSAEAWSERTFHSNISIELTLMPLRLLRYNTKTMKTLNRA
jgi:hypothetical protein